MNAKLNMRRANDINQILENCGEQYRVHYHEPVKNGTVRPAFALESTTGEYNLSPNVYLDDELLEKSDTELIQTLGEIYDGAKGNMDISKYLDPDYVKMNVRPRLLNGNRLDNISKTNIVYRPYLDMVETLYLPINKNADGFMSMQMSHAFLDAVGVNESDAFQYAIWNVVDDLEVTPIGQVIESITGMPQPEIGAQMLVLTNKPSTYGAAVMLNHSVLEQARTWLGSDSIVILPSSIHEVLCCAIEQDAELERFREMVKSVNDSVLEEDELLSYSVYRWDGREVTIG